MGHQFPDWPRHNASLIAECQQLIALREIFTNHGIEPVIGTTSRGFYNKLKRTVRKKAW